MLRQVVSYIVMVALSFSTVVWNVEAFSQTLAGATQIYKYAKTGNITALRSIKAQGQSLDALDQYGNTALCRSVWMKDYYTFSILKQNGASVSNPCISKIPAEKVQEFNASYTQWAKGVNSGKIAYGSSSAKAVSAKSVSTAKAAKAATTQAPRALVAEEAGLSVGAKVAIGVGVAAVVGGGIALAVGGGGGSSSGSDDVTCAENEIKWGNQCYEKLTCGLNQHQEANICVCDSGYTMFGDACYRTLDCGANGHQSLDTCICDTGYTGSTCSECDSGYGHYGTSQCYATLNCVNGTQQGASCVCSPGWTGADCSVEDGGEEPDLCVGVNCGEHGTCNPEDGVCICTDGYTGTNCQIPPAVGELCEGVECPSGEFCNPLTGKCETLNLCNNVDCGDNGTCWPFTGQCICDNGYSGVHCEVPPADKCAYVNCGVHGTCNPTDGSCSCADGYTGANCQVPPSDFNRCEGVSCSGHGSCDPDNGLCLCDDGYEGANCQIELEPGLCSGKTCSGNGSCDVLTGECLCYEGWTGNSCEFQEELSFCDKANCGMGVCNEETQSCICIGGWSGSDCLTPPTSDTENLCANKSCGAGYCVSSTGQCECIPGYSGEDCRTITSDPYGFCQNVSCGAHGVCDTSDGTCICDEGYSGSLCQNDVPDPEDVCDNVNCGSHGRCSIETGLCVCEEGYSGSNCQIAEEDKCAGVSCGSHGTCSPDTGACVCTDGYKGENCDVPPEVDLCEGVSCGSNASCDGASGKCVCNSGYVDWDGTCYADKDCPENSTQQGTTCVCNEGYVDFSGICYVALTCPTNEEQLKDQCVCKSGFGRDSTGACVAKSADVIGKMGDASVAEEVVNTSGITLNNDKYADVWGMRDGRLINNNTIDITNNGDGNVTGMYSDQDIANPQNIFNARVETGSANGKIIINNKGNGNIVGIKGGEYAYNAMIAGTDDGKYPGGTATGLISITSEGNGWIQGLANGASSVNYNAYAPNKGTATGTIEITSIGNAGIVAQNGGSSNALAKEVGEAIGSISVSSTGSNRAVTGYYSSCVGGSCSNNANTLAITSGNTTDKQTAAKATGNISLTIREGGADLEVYGIEGDNIQNAMASGVNGYAAPISKGTITIDHEGKGSIVGLSNGGGKSYNAVAEGVAQATGVITINSIGDAFIKGLSGSSNAFSNAQIGGAEGQVFITSRNSSSFIYGLSTLPLVFADTSVISNAYANSGSNAVAQIDVKAYNHESSLYGMSGAHLYNAISKNSKSLSVLPNANAIGSISLFSDSSYVAGIMLGTHSNSFAYNAYAVATGTGSATATGTIDITHIGIGRVRGMVTAYGLTNVDLYNAYGNGATGRINIQKANAGNAIGMFANGDIDSSANNNSNSSISIISSDNATVVGMYADSNSSVSNFGSITLSHGSFTDSDGVQHEADNTGSLAIGIYAKPGSTVVNNGSITISGFESAYGIYGEEGAKVTNAGTITIDGDSNSSNAIKLNGAELFNPSEISSTTALDLSSFGGKVTLSDGGSFKASEISGDLNLATDIISKGFESEYKVSNAIISDKVSDLSLISSSALFDASLNSTSETTHDIVMTRKAFADVIDDNKIADFLENNYALKNNEDLFNTLKAASTKEALLNAWNRSSGTDTLTNFAYEDFAVLRSLSRTMNDALFAKKGENRSIVGYDHLYQHRDSKSGLTGYKSNADSSYGLTDKMFGDFRFGLGLGVTRYSSDYRNDSDRTETLYQAFMPIGYEKGGFRLVSIPRFGYGNGHYTRSLDSQSAKGKTEKWLYGITNEVRYPIEIAGLMIEPAVEFNILGWHTKGHTENESSIRAVFKSDNLTSVEAGVGLYVSKDMSVGRLSKLKFKVGGAYYHEMAEPYKQEMGIEGMSGSYELEDWTLGRNRGLVSGEIGYDYKNIGLYAKFTQFIENDTRFNMNAGVRLAF